MSPAGAGRPALVAVAATTVAWAASRLPTGPGVVATAVIVGGVALALASVPAALLALVVLDRLRASGRRLVHAGTVALGTALVAWVAVDLAGADASGVVALVGSLVALAAFGVVLPLAVGSLVAERSGVGLRTVLVAWPPSLLAGALLFVAPAPGGVDLAHYNALFLTGRTRVAALAAVAAVVVLGPTAVVLAAGQAAAGGRCGGPEGPRPGR